jgi:hypothetical protein
MAEVRLGDPAVLTFVVLPIVLAAAFTWAAAVGRIRDGRRRADAVRFAAGVALAASVWMALAWYLAAKGILRDWTSNPPPFALFVLAILCLGFLIAFSRSGRLTAIHIPLWLLVAIQGFRLPLELAMHSLYERGIMPQQMTYTGRNFDIVTGATALIVAALLRTGRAGRRTVVTWNLLGLALLANIIAVAVLSTPRFQYFGPDRLNTFVTYPPFVWLPAVMVLAALAGHLIVFRALRAGNAR